MFNARLGGTAICAVTPFTPYAYAMRCGKSARRMKQLVLTKIDSIPNERQAEHLGPWSLSESQFFEWEWKKYEIEPALKSEEVHFVSRRLEKVCEFYLSRLNIRQNERHGRSYSSRYWRILLMPWLINLVMCAFERFLRVRNRVRNRVPYLVYLSPKDESLSSITTPHFNQMLIDDPLNRLIFSKFHPCLRTARLGGVDDGMARSLRKICISPRTTHLGAPLQRKTTPFSKKCKEKWRCIAGRASSLPTWGAYNSIKCMD